MANFYSDKPELKFHLKNALMKKIVALREGDYSDAAKYDYAPVDFNDAMDSYDRVLEIVGDVTANVVAPNAEGVDAEGPHLKDGRGSYAEGTKENLAHTIAAGINGMTMRRR